jgi:hypothetical protein
MLLGSVVAAGGASAQFEAPVALAPLGASPGVAVDGSGNATVGWTTAVGAAWVVQARRLSASGELGPVLSLSGPLAAAPLAPPEIRMNRAGEAAVVWREADGSGGYRIRTRLIAAAGTVRPLLDLPVSPPAPPVPPSHAFDVDASGNAVFVWSDVAGVLARRVAPDGSAGPVVTVCGPTCVLAGTPDDEHLTAGPAVAVDRGGVATVSWITATQGIIRRLFHRARQIGTDDSLGPEIEIADGLSGPGGRAATLVVVAPDGTAMVVWREEFGPMGLNGVTARPIATDGSPGAAVSLGSWPGSSTSCAEAPPARPRVWP